MLQIDRLLDIITGLIWVITLLGTVSLFLRTTRRRGLKAAVTQLISFKVLLPLIVASTLSILSAAIVFIQPQEIGVVISVLQPKGYRAQPLESGLHLIVPLAEKVIRYPISWQTYTMSIHPLEGQQAGDDSIVARTSDGQEVTLDISIMFRINPEDVVRLHIEWQDRYINDMIRPVMRGVVRDVVSEFTIQEVNGEKREDVQAGIVERLAELQAQVESPPLIIRAIILRNITFSPQYARAVEQKQIAEQDRLLKEYQADQLRRFAAGEAEAIRIKANAQAYALRVIAQAINNNQDLLTYQYIDKLAPGIRVMLLPSDAPFILPLQNMDLTGGLTSTQIITDNLLPPLNTVVGPPAIPDPSFLTVR